MEEKKEVKIGKVIGIIVIVAAVLAIIGGVCWYIYVEKKNNNAAAQNNSNETNVVVGNNTEEGQEIDFNSAEVQKIFPLTGAFPGEGYQYLYKLGSVGTKDITNDFILKMGFSKVTKDDWVDSYKGEDLPVSIPTSLLDKYIKDIFGEISYTKTDFSNEDVVINNDFIGTGSYSAKFDNNQLIITRNNSDVGADGIAIVSEKAIKYSDRIEISLNPVFLKFDGFDENGEINKGLKYIAYTRYNYDKKEYEGKIKTDVEYEDLSGIDISKLDTIKLIYKLNNNSGKYYFSEMTKELSSNV